MRGSMVAAAVILSAALVSPLAGQAPAPASGESAKKKLNLDKFVAEVDKNKDGCMSHEEWSGLGLPESAYNMLAEEGCVTKQKMLDTEGPDGIDLNGDGSLTVAEMLEFDKKMSGGGGPGGPAGGSPPEKRE